MPYITDARRYTLDMPEYPDDTPQNAGELNYTISVLLVQYLSDHGLSYQTCNDIVGALDNAKDEFKRRVQNPYEDQKIQQNGDIGYERFLTHNE